jgi:hypothetical protein
MTVCPHLSTCPLFPLLRLKASLNVWQQNYCESSFERCARFQRAIEGKLSPMNLLPNGAMLSVPSAPDRKR